MWISQQFLRCQVVTELFVQNALKLTGTANPVRPAANYWMEKVLEKKKKKFEYNENSIFLQQKKYNLKLELIENWIEIIEVVLGIFGPSGSRHPGVSLPSSKQTCAFLCHKGWLICLLMGEGWKISGSEAKLWSVNSSKLRRVKVGSTKSIHHCWQLGYMKSDQRGGRSGRFLHYITGL